MTTQMTDRDWKGFDAYWDACIAYGRLPSTIRLRDWHELSHDVKQYYIEQGEDDDRFRIHH